MNLPIKVCTEGVEISYVTPAAPSIRPTIVKHVNVIINIIQVAIIKIIHF